MRSEKINFLNGQGIELVGRMELPPDRHPIAFALLAHCFTCGKNLSAVRNISRALTEHGFGVFRFDFTGLGESEGEFVETNFSSNIQDLISAADHMKANWQSPKLIIGHSLGGAAAIFAGGRIPTIQAIATIGAPSSPQHIAHLFSDKLEEIKAEGHAMIEIEGSKFAVSAQLIRDIAAKNMSETLAKLVKPILIMHSPQDKVVEIDNAAKIYQAAKHPKSFISLDDADHMLLRKDDAEYVANTLAAWSHRYIS